MLTMVRNASLRDALLLGAFLRKTRVRDYFKNKLRKTHIFIYPFLKYIKNTASNVFRRKVGAKIWSEKVGICESDCKHLIKGDALRFCARTRNYDVNQSHG